MTGGEDLARATSERGELLLRRRPGDGAVELRVNGVFVMDTVHTESERLLAATMLESAPRRRLRVLIGGLGLGFTVREVLTDPRVRAVEVYEIEDDLVRWFREGIVPGADGILADPRVHLHVTDVGDAADVGEAAEVNGAADVDEAADVDGAAGAARAARTAGGAYDAVLLDVDNGPGQLVHTANTALYEASRLRAWRAALRRGGLFAVWSAESAPELLAGLRAAFGNGCEREVPVVLGTHRTAYYLLAARAGAAEAPASAQHREHRT
ncbi:polyamine aminopropyltransferase [Bounagaea algeriensis]